MKEINRVPAVLIVFAFVSPRQIQSVFWVSLWPPHQQPVPSCLCWFVFSLGPRSKPRSAAHSHNKCLGQLLALETTVPQHKQGCDMTGLPMMARILLCRVLCSSSNRSVLPSISTGLSLWRDATSNRKIAERHGSFEPLHIYMYVGGLLNKTKLCYAGGCKERWSILK